MGQQRIIQFFITFLIIFQLIPTSTALASDDCSEGCYDLNGNINGGDIFTWYCAGLFVDIDEGYTVKDVRIITSIELKIIKPVNNIPDAVNRQNESEYMLIKAMYLGKDNKTTNQEEKIILSNNLLNKVSLITPNSILLDNGVMTNRLDYQALNNANEEYSMGHETMSLSIDIHRYLVGDSFFVVKNLISKRVYYQYTPQIDPSVNWYGLEITEINKNTGLLINWNSTRVDPEGDLLEEIHISSNPIAFDDITENLDLNNPYLLSDLVVVITCVTVIRSHRLKRSRTYSDVNLK